MSLTTLTSTTPALQSRASDEELVGTVRGLRCSVAICMVTGLPTSLAESASPMRKEECFIAPGAARGNVFNRPRNLLRGYRDIQATEHARKPRMKSRICYACTSFDHQDLPRRRFFALTISAVLAAAAAPSPSQATPRRTIFDEERELNEKAKKAAEEAQLGALRSAFEAVQKASEQLGDLQSFVEEENWDGVRQFTRLFNNSVEREGIEAIAKKLPNKDDRKAAVAVGKNLTSTLILIDRCAQQKDKTNGLLHVDEARAIVSSFQSFKP